MECPMFVVGIVIVMIGESGGLRWLVSYMGKCQNPSPIRYSCGLYLAQSKSKDQLMEEEGCDEEDCVDSARAALQYPLWGRIETRDARTQTSGCHY